MLPGFDNLGSPPIAFWGVSVARNGLKHTIVIIPRFYFVSAKPLEQNENSKAETY